MQVQTFIVFLYQIFGTNSKTLSESTITTISSNKNSITTKAQLRMTLKTLSQLRSTVKSTLKTQLLNKLKTFQKSKHKSLNKNKNKIKSSLNSKHKSLIKLRLKLETNNSSKNKNMISQKLSLKSKAKSLTSIKSLAKSLSKSLLNLKSNQKLRIQLMSKVKSHVKALALLNSKLPGIIERGWIKQIMIVPGKDKQDFEVNEDYSRQQDRVPISELARNDAVGSIDIPDRQSFFFVMTPNTINILSSRRNQITKTIDVIDLNILQQIKIGQDKEGNMLQKGGLKTMGTYDEGRCFQLDLKNGLKQIMCNTNEKLVQQLEDNIFRQQWAQKKEILDPFKDEMTQDRNFTIDYNKFDLKSWLKAEAKAPHRDQVQDLGDWSICDKVCAGGSQSKWRGCKPPAFGHKCNKPPIKLKRSCNTQPCMPNQRPMRKNVQEEDWKQKQPSITLPVKLDARFVTHRQQQQEDCRIRDEDLCVRRADLMDTLDTKVPPILPGRAVMNTRTFSYYENNKYDSIHRSILLQDIEVADFPHDSNCIEIKSRNDPGDVLTLCGCPFAPNSGYSASSWKTDIIKFRDACNASPDGAVVIKDNEKIELNIGNETVEVGGDQLRNLAKEAALANKQSDDLKEDEEEEKKMNDAINRVESITADATENEFYKEQLVQNEDQLKAKRDLEKLDLAIQKEAEKLKCIQTYMDREAKRQAKVVATRKRHDEIAEVEKQVKEQVKSVKNVFHTKMGHLAKETERMKSKKMQKLTEYKLKITRLLVDQQARGSVATCKLDKQEIKDTQCNARFPVEWFENKQCRDSSNFCGVCCDKEFSVRWAEDREKCIYECKIVNGMVIPTHEKLTGSNYSATVNTITK